MGEGEETRYQSEPALLPTVLDLVSVITERELILTFPPRLMEDGGDPIEHSRFDPIKRWDHNIEIPRT